MLAQYILKGCPRCMGGDLILEFDILVRCWVYHCFHCGHETVPGGHRRRKMVR